MLLLNRLNEPPLYCTAAVNQSALLSVKNVIHQPLHRVQSVIPNESIGMSK
jgi:hypothetical protein